MFFRPSWKANPYVTQIGRILLCDSVHLIRIASRNRNRTRGSSTAVDGHDRGFDQLLSHGSPPESRGPSSRKRGRVRVRVTFWSYPPQCALTFDHRWLRHPSYTGFFYWAVGTQMVLQNHLCFVVFTLILWRFFYHRTRCECPSPTAGVHTEALETDEEGRLIHFFGDEYREYRKTTRTFIPFIP